MRNGDLGTLRGVPESLRLRNYPLVLLEFLCRLEVSSETQSLRVFGSGFWDDLVQHHFKVYNHSIRLYDHTDSLWGRVGVRAASQAQLEAFGLVVVKVFPVFDAKVASSTS